ncbi:hypothetical protein Tco_0764198 [Tanacetum coccineum]
MHQTVCINSRLCGGNLEGFVRIDQLESLMPIMDMKVVTLSEDETAQILVTPCGRGPRSSLRILRPGLSIIEMAVLQFPSVLSAVWTVKRNVNDEFDAYIVISFFLLVERLLKRSVTVSKVGFFLGVLNAVIFQMDGLGFKHYGAHKVLSSTVLGKSDDK